MLSFYFQENIIFKISEKSLRKFTYYFYQKMDCPAYLDRISYLRVYDPLFLSRIPRWYIMSRECVTVSISGLPLWFILPIVSQFGLSGEAFFCDCSSIIFRISFGVVSRCLLSRYANAAMYPKNLSWALNAVRPSPE